MLESLIKLASNHGTLLLNFCLDFVAVVEITGRF